MIDRYQQARRACTMIALALTTLSIATPACAAPTPGAATLVSQSAAFRLAGARRLRVQPAHLPVSPLPAPEPGAPPMARQDNPLTDLLTLRDDLRVLVNQGLQDARGERITLGLNFARFF